MLLTKTRVVLIKDKTVLNNGQHTKYIENYFEGEVYYRANNSLGIVFIKFYLK